MSKPEDTTELLERAQEQLGERGAWLRLVMEMSKGAQITQDTRNLMFGLFLGQQAAREAHYAVRPWQYVALILGVALFILVLYINNVMFQIAVGVI